MDVFYPPGVGWQRDLPDFRDYTPNHPRVEELLKTLALSRSGDWRRNASVDLREFMPGVINQRNVNSSTAHACVALIEYFERRAYGKIHPLSALYVYKGARELLGTKCDDGVDLRTALKAIVRFGVPPEHRWPNREENVDLQPDAFLLSYADDFRPIVYVRLDDRNSTGQETLNRVRAFLAAGFPVAFGFPVPTSITWDSDIPYRPALDASHGGQAVLAVGYDDKRIRTSKGALLVRSSWGREWGDDGYGWLPYGYVAQQLATDFWTMLRLDWLESGELHRPVLSKPRRKDADSGRLVRRKKAPR